MTREEACRSANDLAEALDGEDYPAARALLSDDCRYEFRGETIDGADEIIALYRDNGDKGRQCFDQIEYRSEISPLPGRRARIDYTDIVTHAGETITHHCAQEIGVDEVGKITLIIHVDLEGEREAIEAFKERHGWGK